MPATLHPSPDGDVNTGGVLIAVAIATFVPALLMVSLRMYARTQIVRAIGWDDWIMVPAIISAFIASVLEVVGAKRGIGRHEYYLAPAQRAEAGKYTALSILFCITALSVGKISMCISLLRILKGANKRFLRHFLWFMIFLQFAVNVVVCTTLFVQCRPTRKVWTPELSGSCWNPTIQQSLNYLQAALSAATDFLLAGLPIYIIKDLQMSRRNKIALCSLMGFGMITGIFAIIRAIYLEPYAKTADPSFTNVGLLVWGGVERNTAIIVACIPFTRPLLHTQVVKSLLSFASRDKSNYRDRSGYSVHPSETHKYSNKSDNPNTKELNVFTSSQPITEPKAAVTRHESESMEKFLLNNP